MNDLFQEEKQVWRKEKKKKGKEKRKKKKERKVIYVYIWFRWIVTNISNEMHA